VTDIEDGIIITDVATMVGDVAIVTGMIAIAIVIVIAMMAVAVVVQTAEIVVLAGITTFTGWIRMLFLISIEATYS